MARATVVDEHPEHGSVTAPKITPSEVNGKPARKGRAKADKADPAGMSELSATAEGSSLDILNVGKRVFAEQGFSRANVAHIAKEADASVGLLYYHFSSKEGLFRAITSDYVKSQGRNAAAAVKLVRAAGVTDGRKVLLAATRAYLSHSWEYRSTVHLLHLDDQPPSVRQEVGVRGEDWMRGLLAEVGLPSQHATEVLATMIMATLGAASYAIAKCSTEAEADDTLELVMTTLERMV
jgi:AcrR family transcriptional regulator